MAHSKNPATYPRAMLDAIAFVVDEGKPLVLPYVDLPNKRPGSRARSQRLRFYGLKSALRESGHRIATMKRFDGLHFAAKGSNVEITHVDDTAEALELQRTIYKAIDLAQGKPPQ